MNLREQKHNNLYNRRKFVFNSLGVLAGIGLFRIGIGANAQELVDIPKYFFPTILSYDDIDFYREDGSCDPHVKLIHVLIARLLDNQMYMLSLESLEL